MEKKALHSAWILSPWGRARKGARRSLRYWKAIGEESRKWRDEDWRSHLNAVGGCLSVGV